MDIKVILKKIRNQDLTPQEKKDFEDWYGESADHRAYYERLKRGETLTEEEVEVEEAWETMATQMTKKEKSKRTWPIWAAASIAVLILGSSLFFFNQKEELPSNEAVVVKAGTDKATLTLGDGEVITLEKDDLFSRENIEVRGDKLLYGEKDKTDKALQYNELSVPKGGQYKVVLADGTEVWLNSDSKIKYPVAFRQGEPRRIELLYGEAFFAVTPSEQNYGDRFEVKSGQQVIEVLGTAFNLTHYKEEKTIKTTLIEGQVALSNADNKQKMDLEPGNQAVFNEQGTSWKVKPVDTDLVVAWKEGYFKFKDMPLVEIMKAISRWYVVDINFEDEALKEMEFNGVFKKDQKLEDILTILRIDGSLDYVMDGEELRLFYPKE